MQVPTKHFPTVGLLSLVLIGAAAGSIVYYQFVAPPSTLCGTNPAHRIIFMTAIIQEDGGFVVTNTAFLNQTRLPQFDPALGANLKDVQYQNYQGASDNRTIEVNVQDKVTLYIKAINETVAPFDQFAGIPGHGFDISRSPYTVLEGELPADVLPFGTWTTMTFRVTDMGSFTYLCTLGCSLGHGNMNGSFSVGCGG